MSILKCLLCLGPNLRDNAENVKNIAAFGFSDGGLVGCSISFGFWTTGIIFLESAFGLAVFPKKLLHPT